MNFSQSATRTLIKSCLVREYKCSRSQAEDLCIKHKEIVNKGISMCSYTWYVALQVARAEGLQEKDEEE